MYMFNEMLQILFPPVEKAPFPIGESSLLGGGGIMVYVDGCV